MTRLIDADALHEQFYDLTKFKKDKHTGDWVSQRSVKISDALRMINDAPTVSAEAVQRWNKGKPTESGEYIVTLDAWGHRYIDVMHYAKLQMPNIEVDGSCWYRDDGEWGYVVYDDNDILAWMPLPKPYKGGGDE